MQLIYLMHGELSTFLKLVTCTLVNVVLNKLVLAKPLLVEHKTATKLN